MSDNRPAPTKASARLTLPDFYNNFAQFLITDILLPILPVKIKEDPNVVSLVDTFQNYCSDDKSFVFVHYVICKKMCEDPKAVQSIRNIINLVQDTPESKEKLDNSVQEIKEGARYLTGVCESVINADDETIRENIEKFCLFVEILTKQFLPPVVASKK